MNSARMRAIEERQTATTEEIAKLRQLKALLRDLG